MHIRVWTHYESTCGFQSSLAKANECECHHSCRCRSGKKLSTAKEHVAVFVAVAVAASPSAVVGRTRNNVNEDTPPPSDFDTE